ncbi:hypothetical protein HDU67_007599, partial [Dinochytrium kinnereticum]
MNHEPTPSIPAPETVDEGRLLTAEVLWNSAKPLEDTSSSNLHTQNQPSALIPSAIPSHLATKIMEHNSPNTSAASFHLLPVSRKLFRIDSQSVQSASCDLSSGSENGISAACTRKKSQSVPTRHLAHLTRLGGTEGAVGPSGDLEGQESKEKDFSQPERPHREEAMSKCA